MRRLFSSEDTVLPFPFYGMTIRVPGDWKVQDAMYPNSIDLDSPRGHIRIWFKDWTDNDAVIREKVARRKSYEIMISSSPTTKLTFADSERRVRSSDNVVYFEYVDAENNGKSTCNWFSMVYGTREVQIALVRGDITDAGVRRDFDTLIANLEFS